MKSKSKLNKFMTIMITCITISLIFFIQSGFTPNESTTQNIRVIVLLDETDSFIMSDGQDTTWYWEALKPSLNKIVKSLESGDEFELIAIDNKGYQTEDVRIPLEVIDQSYLRAVQQKNKITRKIDELRRRKEKYSASDIFGALKFAASDARGYKTRIFCFSDMEQIPSFKKNETPRLDFSGDTKAYFFVNVTGEKDWNETIKTWEPMIKQAGLQFIYEGTETNFIKITNVNVRLTQIMSKLRN